MLGRGGNKIPQTYCYYCCLLTQLCLTVCNSMDCSPPGSSVHGILQAKILKWVAISFSKGSSWARDQTRISYMAGRFFTAESTGKPSTTFSVPLDSVHIWFKWHHHSLSLISIWFIYVTFFPDYTGKIWRKLSHLLSRYFLKCFRYSRRWKI